MVFDKKNTDFVADPRNSRQPDYRCGVLAI